MGITYRQTGINNLIYAYSNDKSGKTGEALGQVSQRMEAIAGNARWSGIAADSVKNYLSDVYPPIMASFGTAIQQIVDVIDMYNKGYRDIDGATGAVIDEAELEGMMGRFDQFGETMAGISDDAKRALNGVSDIGVIPYGGIPSVENQLHSLVRRLRDLKDAVGTHESSMAAQASHLSDLVAKALDLVRAQQKTDITNYSQETLINSPEYIALAEAYEVVESDIQANAEFIEEARQERVELLTELYEERVAEAEKKKKWLGVLCVVASVAVTVATGGAAGPAVVAAFATGALSAGASSYWDQSVGTVACPGKPSWGKVIKDAAVGGTISAATTAIGLKFDKLGEGKKVLTKMLYGGLKSTAQGAATDMMQTTYDSLESGQGVLESLKSGVGSGLDLRKRASEFAGGFVKTGVKEGFTKIEKDHNWFTGKTESANREYEHAGQVHYDKTVSLGERALKSAWHGGVETLADSTGTFTKTFGNTFDLVNAWDAASDPGKCMETFLTSTGAEFASEVHEYRQEKKALAEYEKELDEIQEKINQRNAKQNEHNREKLDEWGEQGINAEDDLCPEFSDSPAMVGEAEIEATYSKKDNVKDKTNKKYAREEDYHNAYDQMVESGQIDPREYVIGDNGHVIRYDISTDPPTKVGDYTMHHVSDYDIRTGKCTMQLVESDVHDSVGNHWGGHTKITNAYKEQNAAEVIEKHNQARTEYLKERGADDRSKSTKKNALDTGKQARRVREHPSVGAQEKAEEEDKTLPSYLTGKYQFKHTSGT